LLRINYKEEKEMIQIGTFSSKVSVASFDVDAENCFTPICPNELPVPGGTEIVPELNKNAKLAKYRIMSKDAHSPKAVWVATKENPQFSPVEGENVDVRWNLHGVPGTKGFELIEGLPPVTDYDFLVFKGVELGLHPYGACYHDLAKKISTGAIEFMRDKGIKIVIVGGLATDYCVKETVLELLHANFVVVVNLGACRGIAEETTEAAIEEMKNAGAFFVNSADELTYRE
jgi:nicotinamidase/pyrazinamidase